MKQIEPVFRTKFWLKRILEEKCQDLKKIADDISELQHQIHYFDEMQHRYQKEVMERINAQFRKYDWNYEMDLNFDEDKK